MYVPFPVEEVNVELDGSVGHAGLEEDSLCLLGSVGEESQLCVPALCTR